MKTRVVSPFDNGGGQQAGWTTAATITNGRLGREWIGGAGNNQPTKYWLDGAATRSTTDEKNEQTVL